MIHYSHVKAIGLSTAPGGLVVKVVVVNAGEAYLYEVFFSHSGRAWRIDLPLGVKTTTEAEIVLAVAQFMRGVTSCGKWKDINGEDAASYLAERCRIPYSQATADACESWRTREVCLAIERRNAATTASH